MSEPATKFSFERVIVEAAGYGHLYGPDPTEWPEFALRAMDGWLTGAIREHAHAGALRKIAAQNLARCSAGWLQEVAQRALEETDG